MFKTAADILKDCTLTGMLSNGQKKLIDISQELGNQGKHIRGTLTGFCAGFMDIIPSAGLFTISLASLAGVVSIFKKIKK